MGIFSLSVHSSTTTWGNVLVDKLWGNLSGGNEVPCKKPSQGIPANNGTESYTTKYTYSDDGLNLVTSQTKGDWGELFFYCPGTDLLASKLYTFKGGIYKREFYEYDASGIITKEFEDDGTTAISYDLQGVTERRIKYIKARKEAPYGLPEIIDEAYLAPGGAKDIQYRKTINTYCKRGRRIQKALYDCNDAYLCTVYWEYDHMGNVVRETDPLGAVTTRQYDVNGNKITEQGPNTNYRTQYTYDFSNRLTDISEIHADGITLSRHFKYNYLGQKIASTDIYGNETQYVYDALGRLIETISPPVYDPKGNASTISKKTEYDLLNYPTATIDGRGHATKQQNTIRGKPFQITYPDGTQERFEYYHNGLLRKHTEVNQNYTLYTYDKQQRPLEKSCFAPAGELISQTKSQYNTFHVLSETDAAGGQKQFQYDAAGRVIEVRKGNNRTTYEYDTVGRLCKTIDWDGRDKGQAKIQIFDLKDRVIEERTEDVKGNWITKATYVYNAEGQRICTIAHTDRGEAPTRTYFDSRQQPCKIVNAAGKATHMTYRYDYRNAFGQIVPYSETTDPDGNISITIKDALGRVQTVLYKDAWGVLQQQKEMYYDGNGNKWREVDTSIQDGSQHSSVTTEWTYDCMNRLTCTHEAVGRSKERITYIKYNRHGQKKAIIKSDGTRLMHSYDNMGRLSTYTASNGSFSYHYAYDANGNLLALSNSVDGTKTTFTYDSNDRLIKETLANDLRLTYRYNGNNHPVEIELPDHTAIGYRYKGSQVVEVQRFSAAKELLYKHAYDNFDLAGKITAMALIGNGGHARFEYDAMGRASLLSYEHEGTWQEKIKYDQSNNVVEKAFRDGIGKFRCSYGYDSLHQLTKENSIAEHSYDYDSLYNRKGKDGRRHTLNALNELLSDGNAKYKYDANGNLIQATSRQGIATCFSYDALDRMTL